jgi:predicted DNA-binding transcriptional regulator AlpA
MFTRKELAHGQGRADAVLRLAALARGTTVPVFVSQAHIASLIGVDRATIFRWRKLYIDFPRGIRIGQTLRFRLQEVELWLQRRADKESPQ